MNTHLVCNLKVGKLQPIAPILPPRFDGPKDKKPLIKIPTYDDVVAAQKRIAPFAVRTPLVESHALGERVGGRVFLKMELLQRTGSFKFRGALNRISLIPVSARGTGVVAFSSGNHAQGVAAAAALFRMPALIVMPSDAPRTKIEGTRAMGAEIVVYDRMHDNREAIASEICAERGATLIKPFDDPYIIAGQGTVGLEIAEDAARIGVILDQVLVPCSGGGLVSGIALALCGSGVGANVHSVEPENFDGMRRSLVMGERVAAPGGEQSIADALMALSPGEHVFALAKNLLAPGLIVTDSELKRAVAFAATKLKLLIEPGGGAALAALLADKARGKTIALVLSGGNADFAAIAEIVARYSEAFGNEMNSAMAPLVPDY
jgi:threonine dehydratase